ncbi:Ig-like domain repeat protein [Nocardioides panaciterrulae]|uniref:Fibronectin type-III domain-containing protein n=1 Tax=Nocardioides panaciterrulae TaxID=661492 RepID=A0A7Y9E4U8_9ACTN|nr:hypothetical protein [Nocardioides panaciterrulae]
MAAVAVLSMAAVPVGLLASPAAASSAGVLRITAASSSTNVTFSGSTSGSTVVTVTDGTRGELSIADLDQRLQDSDVVLDSATVSLATSIMADGPHRLDLHGAALLEADVAVSTQGSVDFAGTVDGSHALSVNAVRGVRFAGSIGSVAPPTSVTIGAPTPTSLAADVTTAGGQWYGGPVALDADSTLASVGGGTVGLNDVGLDGHRLGLPGDSLLQARVGGPGTTHVFGGGTTTIAGSATVESPTVVEGDATLRVDGVAGEVTFTGNGTLAGNGRTGDVRGIAGMQTIRPGTDGRGTLSTHSIAMTAASDDLRVTLGPDGTSGRVISQGSTALAGHLTVHLADGFLPAVGSTFTIVESPATATPIQAAFTNMPDGSELPIDGVDLRIDYGSHAVTLTVIGPPEAPTSVTAAPGAGQARVSFSAPAADGGSPVTGYTVTAVDLTTPAEGGQVAHGTSSPITVDGLTDGDLYVFTVTAENAAGSSAPSQDSPAVTPRHASTTTLTPPTSTMVGVAVTLTATVAPAPSAGTVTFTDDGHPVAGCAARPVSTTDGRATCTTSFEAAGSHSIQATFSGSPQAEGSSGSTTIGVDPAQPPVADAGPDQDLKLAGAPTLRARLDGAGPTDDGEPNALTYTWRERNVTLATGVTATVPLGAGTHHITLTVDDGQFTSTDEVVVTVLDPTPPVVTPTTAGPVGLNGWYVGDATVTWSVTDPESDVDASVGCGATVVDADTVATTITCRATSAGGTTTVDQTVHRDATPPTVDYAGNTGGYALTDTVHITCSATDLVSRVASDSCTSVDSPAYLLPGGPQTLTASATDNAGNIGHGSTSFTVVVDAGTMCDLIGSWTDKGTANSLCTKLHHRSYTSFDNEVRAQTGKRLTVDQAAALLRLRREL